MITGPAAFAETVLLPLVPVTTLRFPGTFPALKQYELVFPFDETGCNIIDDVGL